MKKILWFTGLSGSGKTTIANKLKEFLEEDGKKVRIIDGDDVRATINKHLGFCPEDIKENNKIIAKLCVEDNKNEIIIVPVISPFKKSRDNAKRFIGEGFHEIYIKCSLEKVKERDTKGLYKKFEQGLINNLIGVCPEVPYEAPENPDILINTEEENVEDSVKKILNFL